MIVDVEVARRVEGVLGRAAAAIAAVRAERDPGSGAAAQAWAGGCLVSTGRDGYVNRGIGGAVGRPATALDVDEAATFFRDRDLPVEIELCPYTDRKLVAALETRGVRRAWSRDVLVRELAPGPVAEPEAGVAVQVVTDTTVPRWQRVHRLGFGLRGAEGERSDTHAAASHAVRGRIDLLASVDGRDVGAASVTVLGGCAVLSGAATVPQWRGRGIQTELVRRRLERAAAAGATSRWWRRMPGAARNATCAASASSSPTPRSARS